jgi:hypothetical protein
LTCDDVCDTFARGWRAFETEVLMFRMTCRVALASCVLLSGCGAADGDRSGPATESGGDPNATAEFAKVKQTLGEPSCGTVAADVTLDMSQGTSQYSPSAYGHPSCTNGYVADLTNARPGALVGGGMNGRLDPFSCALLFGYVSVWAKQGTTYVKVQEVATLGHSSAGMCFAEPTVTIPTTGTGPYRIVASAGWLFGLVQLPTLISF